MCTQHTSFFGRSISPPTSRYRIHAVAFTLPLTHRSNCTAALAGALCRWKRTTRSAFSNAEHDAGGREPARAGAGRGRAGRGRAGQGEGLFLKRGVLGWDSGAFYVRTYPQKGCVTAEERTGVEGEKIHWKSGQKVTPSEKWAKVP